MSQLLSHRRIVGLGLLFVALGACDSPAAVDAPGLPVVESSVETQQQAYLQEVAQTVAIALQDQGLRQRVLQDMHRSTFTEHKLHFEDYLRGNSGGILLTKMVQHSNRSRDALLDLLNYMPVLEMYMPVRSHRESWEGTDDILVSAHRVDPSEEFSHDRTGYKVSGEAVFLSAERAPLAPVIVVGPAEADFVQPLDLSIYHNVNDQGGRSVGSYDLRRGGPSRAVCDPENPDCTGGGGTGGGGGGGSNPPADTAWVRGIGVREYIEQMWTPNDHEPWDQGAPEFDLFFAGNSDSDGGAEIKNVFRVPEDPWSGSDDDNNSRPRYFGGFGLTVATWDTDYGNRLLIKCMEDDPDFWEQGSVTLSGSTQFAGVGVEVSFEATWADIVGGYDDFCGENNVLLRTSSNVWTPIYRSTQDYRYFWDGFNDGPRWNGFGVQVLVQP